MSLMERRKLGKTGLEVGVIGLGTEYLYHEARETVASVVAEAVDRGVSFVDILGAGPDYRDNLGAAIKGKRDRLVLQGHLGTAFANGQGFTTRDRGLSEQFFHDLLNRLGTDYVDVINIQMVDKDDDYERDVMGSGGLLEMARRFQRAGKARFVGLSTHEQAIALKAVASGAFDSIMVGLNMKWQQPEVGPACAGHGVGMVCMKPFSGGEFFQEPYSRFITPVNAIAYVLAQPGVTTVVPGARNAEQLRAALAYVTASETEREFQSIVSSFKERAIGACVYCNHCLPCAAGIDVGATMWALRAKDRGSEYADGAYRDLKVKPSACTGCGDCLERCPFKVDIPGEMKRATRLFENR